MAWTYFRYTFGGDITRSRIFCDGLSFWAGRGLWSIDFIIKNYRLKAPRPKTKATESSASGDGVSKCILSDGIYEETQNDRRFFYLIKWKAKITKKQFCLKNNLSQSDKIIFSKTFRHDLKKFNSVNNFTQFFFDRS